MTGWLAQHARSLVSTLRRFGQTPLGSLLSIVAIGVALSFPVGLYVLIDNLQAAAGNLAVDPQVSVFMALDASRAEVAQIDSRLKQNSKVRRFRFVPREQALQELRQSSGLADVVDSLPQNPLPDAFVVDARENTPQALEALRDELKQWPRVAHVQLDSAWARRLDAVLRVGRVMVVMLGGLLALALAAITFNTTRLQVLTRREEIEVTKLIGGTDAFIRRPFLYYGALQGAASGAVAWLLVTAVVWILNRNMIELSQAYASLFELRYVRPGVALALVGASSALGWIGARLSVSHHLRSLHRP